MHFQVFGCFAIARCERALVFEHRKASRRAQTFKIRILRSRYNSISLPVGIILVAF